MMHSIGWLCLLLCLLSGFGVAPSSPADPFIVSCSLSAHHSSTLMEKKIRWLEDVTLQSVHDASIFQFPRRAGIGHVFFALSLGGSYLDFVRGGSFLEKWTGRFPLVKVFLVDWNTTTIDAPNPLSELMSGYYGTRVLSVTHLDADDALAPNFFYQLADLKKMTNFSTHVLVTGSHQLDSFNVGLAPIGSGFYCQYEHIRLPGLLPLGLTVSLRAAAWAGSLKAPLEFWPASLPGAGRPREYVRGLLEAVAEGSGPRLQVSPLRNVMSQPVGLHLRTELCSAHIAVTEQEASFPCALEVVRRRVGADLAGMLWSRVRPALPRLTQEELVEVAAQPDLVGQAVQEARARSEVQQ
jgi:hypothetical protein